jgi:hypothetical protein
MDFLPRSYYQPILALFVFAGLLVFAQTAPTPEVNRIRSVRVIPGGDGAAIEIITSRPVTPTITTLNGPSRLVIDLPDSFLSSPKAIDFRSAQIERIRANQFQNAPPISRVVVDLSNPIGYSWDAAGNRLMIRLKPLEQKIAPAPRPELALDDPGTAGASVQTVSRAEGQGSSLTAGSDTAIMHLPRGGQVRVCPSTTLSVNYSKSGRDMLLAMNSGALEAHYVLDTSSDSVMTPDFRILFVGPGEFDYAISADSRGNTCVKSLRGNAGSVIVSELLGDGTYQVKSDEGVVFHGGQISQHSTSVPENCGCPEALIPELLASAATRPGTPGRPQPDANSLAAQPLPDPDKVHIKVDAPFVFRAKDPQAPSAPTSEVARLSLVSYQMPEPLEVTVLPPEPQVVAAKPRNNTGFLGKIKGFFSAIFR